MKPLELNHYPLDPAYPAGYKLGRDTRVTYRAANGAARAKRLTDAELAAEFWFASGMAATRCIQPELGKPDGWLQWNREASTIHRFATLPSYDEVAA